MSDEQQGRHSHRQGHGYDPDPQLQQAHERLQQLDRWLAVLKKDTDRFDAETRSRLQQKVTRERASMLRRIEGLEERPAVLHSPAAPGVPAVPVVPEVTAAAAKPAVQAARKEKTRRGPRIALAFAAALAVLIALGVFFGARQVDSYAETVLDREVTLFIEQSGLSQLISYSRLEVNTLLGQVRFFDVSFVSANPRSRAHADELVIRMSHQDLVRLARDPDTAVISGIRVSLLHGDFSDSYRDTQLGFDEATFGVSGRFAMEDIQRPGSFLVREITFDTQGLYLRDAASGWSGRVERVGYTLNGDLVLEELENNPHRALEQLSSLRMQLAGTSIALSGPRSDELREIQLMLGEHAWVAELENWFIEESSLNMLIEPAALTLESFSFASPMLQFDGNIKVDLDARFEPTGFEGEVQVRDIHSGIRAALMPYIAMTEYRIPTDGPFTARFRFDPLSGPEIEIR